MANTNRTMPQNRYKSPEVFSDSSHSLADFGKSLVRDTADNIGRMGGDMMDQLMGTGSRQEQNTNSLENDRRNRVEQPSNSGFRERITVFSLREQKERQEIQQIKELLKQIKEELQAIKNADSMIAKEIKDAEKLTLEVDPKAGIYHIRFLEVILKLLHTARMKINESGAWLQAMRGKPKRGSAFMTRSKKAGTQYSQSNELSAQRPGV